MVSGGEWIELGGGLERSRPSLKKGGDPDKEYIILDLACQGGKWGHPKITGKKNW